MGRNEVSLGRAGRIADRQTGLKSHPAIINTPTVALTKIGAIFSLLDPLPSIIIGSDVGVLPLSNRRDDPLPPPQGHLPLWSFADRLFIVPQGRMKISRRLFK
jgi:hypothetical protein